MKEKLLRARNHRKAVKKATAMSKRRKNSIKGHSRLNKNKRKSHYNKTSNGKRQKYIEQVLVFGTNMHKVNFLVFIVKAALNLGLKYSTAKSILRIFQNEGRIEKKTSRTRQILPIESIDSNISPEVIVRQEDRPNFPFHMPHSESGETIRGNFVLTTKLPQGFWEYQLAQFSYRSTI